MLPSLVKLPRNSNNRLEWSDDLLEMLKTHRDATYKTPEVKFNQRLISATRGTANTPFYMLVACSLLGGYELVISTTVPHKIIVALTRWIQANGPIGDTDRPIEYNEVKTDGDACYNTTFYNLNIRSKLPVAVADTDIIRMRYTRSLQLMGHILQNVTPKLFKAIQHSIETTVPVSSSVKAELMDRLEYAIHLIEGAARTSPTLEEIRRIQAVASNDDAVEDVVINLW